MSDIDVWYYSIEVKKAAIKIISMKGVRDHKEAENPSATSTREEI